MRNVVGRRRVRRLLVARTMRWVGALFFVMGCYDVPVAATPPSSKKLDPDLAKVLEKERVVDRCDVPGISRSCGLLLDEYETEASWSRFVVEKCGEAADHLCYQRYWAQYEDERAKRYRLATQDDVSLRCESASGHCLEYRETEVHWRDAHNFRAERLAEEKMEARRQAKVRDERLFPWIASGVLCAAILATGYGISRLAPEK